MNATLAVIITSSDSMVGHKMCVLMWFSCFVLGLAAAVAGMFLLIQAYNAPSGPLGLWWDVSLCRNDSATFMLNDTIWRVYYPRPVVSGALPGTPCPLVAKPTDATDAPVELMVFPDVGFRRALSPAEYRPLLLVPTGTYVMGTLEVVGANNGTVYVEPLAFGGMRKPSRSMHPRRSPPCAHIPMLVRT